MDDYDQLADLVKPWKSIKSAELRRGKTLGLGYTNFVATSDNHIVGWVQGVHNSLLWEQFHGHSAPPQGPRCSFVYFLYVGPEVRESTGKFGSSLLRAFELDALEVGNNFVCLDPNPGEYGKPVHGFYQKQGYFPAGESAGSQSFLMGKRLT